MARAGPSSAVLALSAALAAVLLLWPRRSDAAFTQPAPLPVDPWAPAPAEQTPEVIDVNSYLRAFLWMIRNAEHNRANVLSSHDYATFYGGGRFFNFNDHPVITGEMTGVKLPNSMCRASGFAPGCVSTAAGAYQIIRPTWERVRAAGTWGPRLLDFSPASQDEAARRLLIETGAYDALLSGDFTSAVQLAAPTWASLPGSTAAQGGRNFDDVLAFFNEGLTYVG